MMTDRYSLAEARAIIDAEKCERAGQLWCDSHDSYMYTDWSTCAHHPGEVADVAAQLLATVERVQALVDELSASAARSDLQESQRRGLMAVAAEVTAAINGEEVTE